MPALALPALAHASSSDQSILMDDTQLIYSSRAHVVQTMDKLAELGVSTVKVSVVWSIVAPHSGSSSKPDFDAADPGAYPSGAWSRYDLIDQTAQQLGMSVYFMFAPPSPAWAMMPSDGTGAPPLGRAPYDSDFQQFVEAVGRRYSGSYFPPGSSSQGSTLPVPVPPTPTLTVPGTGVAVGSGAQSDSDSSPLPAVHMWGLWNEPNERSWLNPAYATVGGRRYPNQPALYRGLVGAAWNGLAASGHTSQSDTILLGETANVGILSPLPFIQDLYCVGSNDQPLTGRAATDLQCPSGAREQFVKDNPALFQAAGWAHHPYGLNVAPSHAYPQKSFITLANLGSLEHTLNSIFDAYGQARPGGIPVYVTEFGYKTRPPNPYSTTSLADQAAWLDEGDYMTWADPFVKSFAQFLLVDSPPKPHTKKGSAAYWSTFQTGLMYANGKPKPAYSSFAIPIWVPNPRPGASVTVWGQLRPANHSTTQYAAIDYRASASAGWTTLAVVTPTHPEGFLVTHVDIPARGMIRLAWGDQADQTVDYSRTVTIG